MHRRNFKVNSIPANRKTDLGINKGSSKNLSPSQKIIREFKKSEINKYGISPSCPDAPRTIATEWQVLYTTQLTKKAKKYHDGFLKLAVCGSQSRQVMLYDETRRLIDSRFLKTNEMIRSGESLMLEGHFVDIGELEGDDEHLIYSSVQERNVNVIEKEIPHVQQFKKLKTQKNNPIEFKRSEIGEQDASPSCPDTSRPSGTEWEVLYTTQLTQKSKKFHDGILKLAHCGSQRRQVFLYDANRRLLDSRFLKSNEMISSGESLKLDCHLVEIGEREGDFKPLKDSSLQVKSCIVVGETKMLHEQVQSHANYPVEWDAMYTTHISQKSKKYHCGILRLSSCGSYRMQVTLLAEDGTSLSCRYLKLSEHLNAGSTCELSNYLVEIGEMRKHSDEHLQKNTALWKDKDSCIRSSSVENIKLSTRVPANKPLSNELQSNASPQKESDLIVRSSQAENSKTTRETFTKKPLRDAHAILSILKKPKTQESIVSLKRESVGVFHASQTSDFAHLNIQNGVQGQRVEGSHSHSSVEEDNKNQEAIITYDYNGENINPSDNRGDPQPKIITSSSFSLGSGASNISRPVFDLEFSDISRSHTSSILNSQVINAHFDCQTPIASVPHEGSSGNKEIKNIPELISSKAASGFSYSQSFKVYPGKSSQACADDIGFGSRCNEASDPCDVELKSPSKHITDEFPSFDLGF